MRRTNEDARSRSTGETRGEAPLARGGAAPAEGQRAGELQPRWVDRVQLERWENEGGAADTVTGPRKLH